ncbi:hypothetical protein B5X24_HaOG215897 [Helicoverpa armigera]|nr:hypothetical protein B5X24_HaOG215897 [Helicoverpa armigera]
MAGAPRGRVPDACGAIVTAGQLAQQRARRRPHPPRITPPALPARGTARTVAGARQNHPRVSPSGARLTPTGGARYRHLSIATPRLRSQPSTDTRTETRSRSHTSSIRKAK